MEELVLEMAQWSRPQAAPPEGLGSIPNTHPTAPNLLTPVSRDAMASSSLQEHFRHAVNRHNVCRQNHRTKQIVKQTKNLKEWWKWIKKQLAKGAFHWCQVSELFQYLGLDFPIFSWRRHVSDCFWGHVINCANLFVKSQKKRNQWKHLSRFINT